MNPNEQFPLRPDSEEFDLLSKIARSQDEITLDEVMTDAEINALAYVAGHRIGMGVQALSRMGVNEDGIRKSVYMDAFILGMRYQEEK